jgi:hypothetical protein
MADNRDDVTELLAQARLGFRQSGDRTRTHDIDVWALPGEVVILITRMISSGMSGSNPLSIFFCNPPVDRIWRFAFVAADIRTANTVGPRQFLHALFGIIA